MKWLTALLILILLSAAPMARAQAIGTNAAQGQAETYTLKLNSQLVVETVVVKDKEGNFIEGLAAKNFVVSEDGVPQTVRICEHQQLANTANPLPVTPSDEENVDSRPIGRDPRSRMALRLRTTRSTAPIDW